MPLAASSRAPLLQVDGDRDVRGDVKGKRLGESLGELRELRKFAEMEVVLIPGMSFS